MNLFTVLRMLSTLRQLRQHEGWSRQQIETYQLQRLAALRTYTYRNSPFYQHFHAGMFDKPLHELPVLTKQLMMEKFDDLVTDRAIRLFDLKERRAAQVEGRYLNRFWMNATSGSTGNPGIFLFNQREWATVLASFTRAYEFAGVHLDLARHRKIAVVSSTTAFHMSYLVGTALRSPWVSSLQLSAAEPLAAIVAQLNDWQPETVIAYASMARALAVEQSAGRLKISPRTIFASSEVLTDEGRRLIEDAWGKVLFNQYAATETGEIAAECDHHQGLHLFEDLVIVENVDEENRPVPSGVYGDKLLVTVLFNRTQPLIRYVVSDSLRMSDFPCACGRSFQLVDGLQGRHEDVLHFPTKDGSEISIHPNVFHEVMDAVSVSGWQIVQQGNTLRILLSGSQRDENDALLSKALSAALTAKGASIPEIQIEHVEAIPRTVSGKAPLIRVERTPP